MRDVFHNLAAIDKTLRNVFFTSQTLDATNCCNEVPAEASNEIKHIAGHTNRNCSAIAYEDSILSPFLPHSNPSPRYVTQSSRAKKSVGILRYDENTQITYQYKYILKMAG